MHLADVADQHGAALPRRDRHATQVVERSIQAGRADDHRFVALLQAAATGARVAVAERQVDLVQRDLVAPQRLRIDIDLVLLDGAAEAHHVGHARGHAKRRANHPVLQRAHLVGRQAGRIERVAIHLADRGGQRRQRRLHAGRQRDVRELLGDLLSREVIARAVGEGQGDERQAGHRDRAQVHQAGNAGHLAFDRQRHRAIDIFRRLSREQRDHLHLHVLDVGEGFDRQFVQRQSAEHHQREREDDDEDALRQREIDEPFDHGLLLVLVDDESVSSAASSNAPRVTTLSPLSSPWST